MVYIPIDLVNMSEAIYPKREELGLDGKGKKQHEVETCEACGAIYIDDDGCPNYCLECEACKRMTKLDDLDDTLLIEAQAEICWKCADVFLEEVARYKAKRVMGDHKGRTG